MDEQLIIPHRLDITRESELIQRFVRVSTDELDNCEDDDNYVKGAAPRPVEKTQPDEPEKSPPEAAEETQPKNVDTNIIEKEVKKKGLRRRRRHKHRQEELYTDKDRAAAVNMGSRDIKQSLKIKRKQDRSKALSIPEEAEPSTFLALGNYELCRGDLDIALDFMNKALELNPNEKNALVARSKCYLLLGQPENALADAETALSIDKNFLKATFQKAESLYYLGDFEHSLMFCHRGLRVRPEHEGFKLGVHKAQKAIENALGGGFPFLDKSKSTAPSRSSTRCSTKQSCHSTSKTANSGSSKNKVKCERAGGTSCKSIRSKNPARLLRELGPDKEYLDNLLSNPNLKCKFRDDDNKIEDCIKNTVNFLNKRQEFWRQQLPANAR